MGYTHGEKWTENKIIEAIMQVVDNWELNRMPSRSEIERFYGNTALSNVITKKYGWYELAKKLKLAIKESETYRGKKQEQIAKETLISKGYTVEKMPQNFPYDLLINNCVKIDVKASKLYEGKNGGFYSFNLERPFPTCDIYLLYLLNNDRTTKNVIVIPSKFVPKNSQISIGAIKSKYDRFVDKWEYIGEYIEFFEKVEQ